jgi:hypothetical protein
MTFNIGQLDEHGDSTAGVITQKRAQKAKASTRKIVGRCASALTQLKCSGSGRYRPIAVADSLRPLPRRLIPMPS